MGDRQTWYGSNLLCCDGVSVKALDAFIPSHPGGSLIHQALGTDASLLFHAHHTDMAPVLAKLCVGYMKPWHSEAG